MGEARELGERWFDTVKSGDADAIAALLTDDADFQMAGAPMPADQAPMAAAGFVKGVPDMDFVSLEWTESADGTLAFAEGRYTGTHTGTLMTPAGEVPPTGNAIDLPFVTVFEARDGKLSAHRAYWDNLTFSIQLGMIPPPPSP
jgi:steroid delta-isomerase-like uncharacterized protein